MNADGSDPRRLTNHQAIDYSPAWSHDGSKIAFISDRDGNKEIYLMEIPVEPGGAVGKPWRLTDNEARDWDPSWSPDGTQIVFVSDRDGDAEIFVVDVDPESEVIEPNLMQLTENDLKDENPAWSPNGARIAFTSKRAGKFEIYVMDLADRGEPTQLTNNEVNDYGPAWSPDGGQILFYSSIQGYQQIHLMNADGSNVIQLTDEAASSWWPDWSPDGEQITFCAIKEDGNLHDIYVMNADGSNQKQVTEDSFDNWWPAWRPSLSPESASVSLSVAEIIARLEGLPLEEFFEESYRQLLLRNPETITYFGVAESLGMRNDRLNDLSDVYLRETQELESAILDLLRSYNRDDLPQGQQVSYDVYEWYLDDLVRGHEFMYYDYPVHHFLTNYP
jgi:Tol biopolymer transport system component